MRLRLGPERLTLVLAACLALAGAGPLAGEPAVPQSRAEISLSFAPVVRAAAPAVVNITARRGGGDRVRPLAQDPFLGDVFGERSRGSTRDQVVPGSGVIVSPDGIVVTNHHVVADAREIRVILNDRREYDAQVILSDPASDLAVLRLDLAAGLPSLPFGDPDLLEIGDLVLAIGNPFGIGQTVTSGIVSGRGRSSPALRLGRGVFIQTDAAINPGNSGGALVNMAGRLVGINTAILTRSGGSQGIGFAIPASLVEQVVAQAVAGNDRFARPWTGLEAETVDAASAAALGLDAPRGVEVRSLHPKSPFKAAGVVPGDVLLAVGGGGVDTPQELEFRLAVLGPGGETPLRWLRAGQTLEARLALVLAPERPERAPVTLTGNTPLQGLTADTVNPAVITERGLPPSAEGVAVTSVEGSARRIGLRPGDVILSINGRLLRDTTDLAHAAGERVRQWEIGYLRDGRPNAVRFHW